MPLAQSGGNNVGSAQIVDDQIINDDVNSAAGIEYSKLNLTGGVKDTDVSSANVLYKRLSRTISAAEILGMYATPIELIASPGVGKVIICENMIVQFIYNGVQYLLGGNVSSAGAWAKTLINTTDMRGTTSKNYTVYGDMSTPQPNTNLTLTNATGAFTTGNSEIKLDIEYKIVGL